MKRTSLTSVRPLPPTGKHARAAATRALRRWQRDADTMAQLALERGFRRWRARVQDLRIAAQHAMAVGALNTTADRLQRRQAGLRATDARLISRPQTLLAALGAGGAAHVE